MNKICSASTKAEEKHKRCFVVFIANFRGVGIEDPSNNYVGAFIAIQGKKGNIFN